MAVAAFPSEADMLAPIARGLPRAVWPGRPKPNLLYEFDVAAGVADIVAVEFDHRAVARRDFAGLDPVVEGLHQPEEARGGGWFGFRPGVRRW